MIRILDSNDSIIVFRQGKIVMKDSKRFIKILVKNT